jgi:hypothetical protein
VDLKLPTFAFAILIARSDAHVMLDLKFGTVRRGAFHCKEEIDGGEENTSGWTKEDNRVLKSLARNGTKTTAIARQLKRAVGATYQQASKLGISYR